VVLLSLVSVALVAGMLVTALSGNAGLTGPVHTPWQAARALPAQQSHLHAATGVWVLADYITSQGWQQNTTGPEPGNLTCPTALTCYVTGDNATSSSGPAQYDSFYVSNDGALSWSVLPVPAGVDFTTPLSCADANDCAAGASDNGQPAFITTANGGHSFTIDPLPQSAGAFYSLECPSLGFCAGLAATSADLNNVPIDATLLSTGNDGASFTDLSMPPGESMDALACPTQLNCVAVGTNDAAANGGLFTGVVASTYDGGQTWTNGALPEGFFILNDQANVSCSDALHCSVLGDIALSVANPSQCSAINPLPSSSSKTLPTSPQGPAVQAVAQQEAVYAAQANVNEAKDGSVTCTGNGPTLVSDIASTSDGGLTWTPELLPATAPQPQLSDVVCASDEYCIATGSVAVPQKTASGAINGGSAIVLVTYNDGSSWSGVSFALPSSIPSGVQLDAFMAVGQVQCPQVNDCVALGVSDQGSKTTPVYRGGPPPSSPSGT
jgi:photosystem II stability/assembly factor-like uncharacterized protein